MVLPTDPGHRAAREQVVLALEEVLDELTTGLCGVEIQVSERLRRWAGMPLKSDPALRPDPVKAPRRSRPAVDPRLADDTGREHDGEYEPAAGNREDRAKRAAASTPTAPAAPPVPAALAPYGQKAKPGAAFAVVDDLPVPDGVPAPAAGAYRRGYADGAGGTKPDSGYGEELRGAAVWRDAAYQRGWRDGNTKRKAGKA